MEHRIVRHGLVDSTSERAFVAVASREARHGDVHVATGQSAGRGRLGRRWSSASGEGLYLSLVLLPERAPHPAALTMGAGLAVLASVRALGAERARLKWPNDVLVPDECARLAKLAGILVESRGLDPALPAVVVGIGINVRQSAFPPELEAERAVTSLARLSLDVTLERALATLLESLGPRMEEACRTPELTARDYAAATGLPGKRVRLLVGRTESRGRLRALELAGIELERDDGTRTRHALEHVQALELID